MHTRTHTLGISSHPRTISLTFIFVPGQVQDPRLNSFIMPTGCHSSVLSQLDTPHPPQQQDAKHPIYSRTTKPLSCLPSPPSFPPHHTKHLTCSFSQQCPPHTGELRHPSICKWQPRLGRQDPITPGNIQLG